MENFIIENDDHPNFEFEGELIGSGSTRDHNSTRWTLYRVYRTKGGAFVAQTIGRSQWDGEVDRFSAAACETEAEVKQFLGFSDAAKEAYQEAGIEATVKVA